MGFRLMGRRRRGLCFVPRRACRRGFTLVELLVAIAIIGLLIALALPAVQMAREAARRTQCRNHLKQLSLATLQHLEAQRHLPTGGWGWHWVGDPDRGYDKDQPGGWLYNTLPYLEQVNLHRQGADEEEAVKRVLLNRVTKTPLPIMNCPTRRQSILYPKPINGTYVARNAEDNDAFYNVASRGDYAINSGSQCHDEYWPGPLSLEEGDRPDFPWHDVRLSNGVSFERSEIQMAQVRDGTTNTLLLGEKYLNPDAYDTGTDMADNESLYTGFNNDLFRCTYYNPVTGGGWTPMQDRAGVTSTFRFGSPHAGASHFAFCDGSVRSLNYTVDGRTFSYLGSRDDGAITDGSGL
jgi:prepilin-type N-terminal cleavage/methylation domain-containing protein/prepilin-type processing-associated H-X9-DG protein